MEARQFYSKLVDDSHLHDVRQKPLYVHCVLVGVSARTGDNSNDFEDIYGAPGVSGCSASLPLKKGVFGVS